MDQTARFALPFLAAGQVQKEILHNEALQKVDMLLCPVVEGPPLAAVPTSPAVGSCYLVGVGATGDWTGHDGAIACFTDGGWRFVAPKEGITVVDRLSGHSMSWRSGVWEAGVLRAQELRVEGLTVVRSRQPAIGDPSGGSVIDGECRAAVAHILSAMRSHGLIA